MTPEQEWESRANVDSWTDEEGICGHCGRSYEEHCPKTVWYGVIANLCPTVPGVFVPMDREDTQERDGLL